MTMGQHKREKSSNVTDLKKQIDWHFFIFRSQFCFLANAEPSFILLLKTKLNLRKTKTLVAAPSDIFCAAEPK